MSRSGECCHTKAGAPHFRLEVELTIGHPGTIKDMETFLWSTSEINIQQY